ncbi:MAG: hypothetical protein FWD88_02240, partial [Treponema sp.]|nr:hypothetical protein [Treponema sp.]
CFVAHRARNCIASAKLTEFCKRLGDPEAVQDHPASDPRLFAMGEWPGILFSVLPPGADHPQKNTDFPRLENSVFGCMMSQEEGRWLK